MNLVALNLAILFTLCGIITGAVIPSSDTSAKQDSSASQTQEQNVSSSLQSSNGKKDIGKIEDHPSDHESKQKIQARKGVKIEKAVNSTTEESSKKVSTSMEKSNISSTAETQIKIDDDKTKTSENVHSNIGASNDRASSTQIQQNESSEKSGYSKSQKSHDTEKYSPYDTKSTKTDTSSSSVVSNVQKYTSNSSDESKSTSTVSTSTESISSSKSSSINKKPLVTYSVEDDPTLLNVIKVRQFISPLTPLDTKFEADNPVYLPPSSDFVLDRSQMQSKREMYIFPLVVLIFLVPMVLGVGIIIVRRVRDYWSTRHYRRMDFLVDGMYNT